MERGGYFPHQQIELPASSSPPTSGDIGDVMALQCGVGETFGEVCQGMMGSRIPWRGQVLV